MIKLMNIQKQFKTNGIVCNAVDNVSLEVAKGEIVGIIGYSGAGKSTLIRIVNQLTKQDKGRVLIDGQDVNALSKKQIEKIRQKIGMIFQHFNLMWSKTVRENIELPLLISKMPKGKREAKIKELLELVGLQEKEHAYPKELSGGQKQRVAIARALANEPNILLCDEATSALDPQTTDDILKLLKMIHKKYDITILMITHQMHVAQSICHKIAVMSDGKIVEENDVRSIFENPKMEITKKFMQSSDAIDADEIACELLKQYPNAHLIHIRFSGDLTNQSILSTVIKKTQLDVNIVHANINNTRVGALGSMYCSLDGTIENMQLFVSELQMSGVQVEVLK